MRERFSITEDQVVVSYAGAIGAAQGLESLVQAAMKIDDARLVILIAGSGTQLEKLKQIATYQSRTRIHFLGRLPEEQMTDFMATSDLAYVSLTDHPLSAVTMPSKTQAALASGRPILAAAPGDLARLVSACGLGFVATPGDAHSVAHALAVALAAGRDALARLGNAARSQYLQEFSVQRTTDVLEEILKETSARARSLGSRFTPSRGSQ